MAVRYKSKILDHLGLGEVLDDIILQDHEQRKVSVGQAVKAMVLNGLGFVNQRLYLVPRFFENKPTERLVGKGIKPEYFDVLGRALDALYAHEVTARLSAPECAGGETVGIGCSLWPVGQHELSCGWAIPPCGRT